MANIYLLPQLRLEETTREQENKRTREQEQEKYSNIYFWAMQQFSDITEKRS